MEDYQRIPEAVQLTNLHTNGAKLIKQSFAITIIVIIFIVSPLCLIG